MKGEGKKQVAGRRNFLAWLAAFLAAPEMPALGTGHEASVTLPPSPVTPFAPVVPGYRLRFPFDEGSHPEFRVEWWYVTGWIKNADGKLSGFQITFFRTRPDLDNANPSAFTAREIMVAHAALSDPAHGTLRHDQRVSRGSFDLAGAKVGRLDVWLDNWSLRQENGAYRTLVSAGDFLFDFTFNPTQSPLLQGEGGFSRKGPDIKSASYYYSLPQLRVSGTLTVGDRRERASGTAWFDHEWSSSYMDKEAVGWDWLGINLADGGALMAFRMRNKQGGKLWAGGAYRSPDGRTSSLGTDQIVFEPGRIWQSPRTGTRYPVSWLIKTGPMEIQIEPLMDDQENDTRLSAGTIYWEGAVEALQRGKHVGRGYLELTGYWRRMSF